MASRPRGPSRALLWAGLAAAFWVSGAPGGGTVTDPAPAAEPALEVLDPARALALGRRIWRNEAGGSIEGLTAWNRGEDFASLGIGHFIWYPAGVEKRFTESFPALLDFMRADPDAGARMPVWLREPGLPCPWPERAAFEAAFQSERMQALRRFLAATIPAQSRFIAARLQRALPAILAAAAPGERDAIGARFARLHGTDAGLYALVDYVNFKGEGIAPAERYGGQGWGLLQVLSAMADAPPGEPAERFADAAEMVLRRRVALAPPERGEERWLAGWMARVDSYRPPPGSDR